MSFLGNPDKSSSSVGYVGCAVIIPEYRGKLLILSRLSSRFLSTTTEMHSRLTGMHCNLARAIRYSYRTSSMLYSSQRRLCKSLRKCWETSASHVDGVECTVLILRVLIARIVGITPLGFSQRQTVIYSRAESCL